MDYNQVAEMFWDRAGRPVEARISHKQVLWLMDAWKRTGNHGRPAGYFAPNGDADRGSMRYWTLGLHPNGSGRIVTTPLSEQINESA